jgi:hypothetical protein
VDLFTVQFDVSDPVPGSGIKTVVSLLDGNEVSNGEQVDLLWFALGTHTLAVSAADVAGWSTSRSSAFEIIATLSSLRDLILELRRRGEIDSDGTANSFISKVEGAEQVHANGKLVRSRSRRSPSAVCARPTPGVQTHVK